METGKDSYRVVERVERTLREHSMVGAGECLLAAVSAGLDSMVMLEVLHRLSSRLGFELCAAHFDHGLRGAEAAARERGLVERRCLELGLGLSCGRAEVAAIARERRLNLQDAARRARYEFFWRCLENRGCSRLATGHHRDDQAETVLIRLLSGSGLVGLAGIPPVSEGGRLVRPLLDIPRAELERFAAGQAVAFAEDQSNLSEKYLRNRVRLRLIPEIEEQYDPSFRDNLILLAAEAGRFRRALEERAGSLAREAVAMEGQRACRIDCTKLQKVPALVRRHLLRQVAEELTGGSVILCGRALAALERLVLCGSSGRSADLPGRLRAVREFSSLAVSGRGAARPEDAGEEPIHELPSEGAETVRLGGDCWELVLERTGPEVFPGAPVPCSAGPEGWYEQWFDLEKLKLPLSVGCWSAGERIRPFGLGGAKKVKKLFQEKKVPLSRRSGVPVVRDAGREVLWLCGVARSEHAPVLSGSERLLRIMARRAASAR
ncbi:MAG: tRNA lysidine(34) synthetase TilS [Candidatus Glassbacteria bacterium]|nr:tRNA lysidine(34) synthetase TilS [Candidatus Glassbacteria bacterium]